MLGLRRALLALFALGVIFAGLDVALALSSTHEDQKVVTAILGPLIGLSFIGTGVFAWWRRPLNRFGLLMTGVGIAWFLAGLTESNNSTVYTIGSYVEPLYLVLVIQMVLSFPTGRLETSASASTIAAAYLDVLAVRLPFFLLGGRHLERLEGPAPGQRLRVVERPTWPTSSTTPRPSSPWSCWCSTLVLLVRKRQAATAAAAPRAGADAVDGAGARRAAGHRLPRRRPRAAGRIGDVAGLLALVAFAILPFAFLAGLVRSRYSRAGAVGELIERLNNPEADRSLGLALADALGDRSLKLVYWRPSAGHYVTYDGRPVELPEPGSGRAVTEVEREGIRVGAIIHDASLADEPGPRARRWPPPPPWPWRTSAWRPSCARASTSCRRRARAWWRSRCSSAGAWSAICTTAPSSAWSRSRCSWGWPSAAWRRARTGRGAPCSTPPATSWRRALEELRELARGIHPAVLTDRGLEPALEALAERAPLPVSLDQMPAERLPAPVEAAAYFVVAEALTNVVKYAGASTAAVRIRRNGSYAVVEVRDDGVGGADPTIGTGLRGLADRLAALDGRLEVHSPPGEGTTVRAEVPCA
jgi:hypothetical protein